MARVLYGVGGWGLLGESERDGCSYCHSKGFANMPYSLSLKPTLAELAALTL